MSKLIDESSIPVLLDEMTVNEKIDLLTGGSTFSSQEIPKYKNILSGMDKTSEQWKNMLSLLDQRLGELEM